MAAYINLAAVCDQGMMINYWKLCEHLCTHNCFIHSGMKISL